MNSLLLYPEENMSVQAAYPSFHDIFKDLNLSVILKTMAQNDVFVMDHIRRVMMVPVCDPAVIRYRHGIIKNFYVHPEILDMMYKTGRQGAELAAQYKKEREQNRSRTAAGAGAILAALRFMEQSVSLLRELTEGMKEVKEDLDAEGLLRFCERFSGYPIEEFEDFHRQLMFYSTGGESVYSIRIRGGLKLDRSRMRSCRNVKAASLKGTSRKLLKLYYKVSKKSTIFIENESLERDLHAFVEKHMLHLMKFYQPLIDDMMSFWFGYGQEISFYKGVHTLQKKMDQLSLPFCYGECRAERQETEAEDLYELSLALYVQVRPVSNSFGREHNRLTIITGANQGGKSTFLRSFGIAQLLMQCGMPVPAAKFHSRLYSGIHTHFTRKEDAMLSRGRLEDELKRMSDIVSQITKDSLVLLNESFASTTEKEGSQIAYNVIMPLYEKGIEVMMVTHLHEFARRMYEKELENCKFLIAERKENGDRTFRMIPGKPHYSSYGTDLYQYMIGKL